jgi:hypothetical protein
MTWARLARLFALPAAFAMLSISPAHAGADARDPDATRISAAGHSLKWNWTPPGRTDRYGHAETLIHASLPAVRQHVVDYARYHEFVPGKFKTSRVVAHQPDGSTDVYLQIAVLHGLVTLWDVTRFAPPRLAAPGVETIQGRMVPGKGNVDDMDVVWTMRALDADWTLLKLDMLLKPGLPAPAGAVDEELRDSAMYAVDAVHDRAQGSPGIAPWGG